MDAPMKPIGPSLPTLPPEPIVMDVTMIFIRENLLLMRPPLNITDSMTSGMPFPWRSGNLSITGATITLPIAGRMIYPRL